MSEAIELYRRDGSATGVFFCSECRAVFPNQEQAQACHGERICACGEKCTQRYYHLCERCQAAKWKEKNMEVERERFDAALKTPWSEYKGEMIYSGDCFYDDLEALEDYLLDAPMPDYVWACKNVGVPKADAESIYENLLVAMWDDADVNDLNGVDELDAAVTAFNEANRSISVWQADYTTAILLNPWVNCARGSLAEPTENHT